MHFLSFSTDNLAEHFQIKMSEQVKSLQLLTHKMQRDITRLKDQISDLAGAVQRRG